MLLAGNLHFLSFYDGSPLVVAAVLANMVWQLGFVALGACGKVRGDRLLMALSLTSSRLGNLSFG